MKLKNTYIILALILVFVIANIRSNYFITGFDNISPYLNSTSILNKTFGNNGELFFAYFPMIFVLPFFEFLKVLNIPLWLINQSYIFICLILGVLGSGYLVRNIINLKDEKKSNTAFLLGGILYLANLTSFWIFNQPNFFFLAAYASIPWLIDWLRVIEEKRVNNILWLKIVRIISLILFLQTTVNFVSTISYTFAIFIISFLTIKQSREGLFRQLKSILIVVLSFLIVAQLSLFIFAGNREFVLIKIFNSYSEIRENPLTEKITEDLRASGVIRNNLINNVLFKNSWVETHDIEGKKLFSSLSYYENPIIMILGLIPFLIALTTIIVKDKDTQKLNRLHLVIFLGLILMSATLLKVTDNIPVISEFFRWSGSKFWPLTLIPIIILATSKIINSNKNWLTVVLVITSLIYVLPIFNGNLFAKQLTIQIPSVYFELDKKLESSKSYYYLPTPSDSYFYTYKFGYFGSEFVPYMTKGDSTTSGILGYFNNYEKYKTLSESLMKCNIEDFKGNIILDTNVVNDEYIEQTNCIVNNFRLVNDLGDIKIYER